MPFSLNCYLVLIRFLKFNWFSDGMENTLCAALQPNQLWYLSILITYFHHLSSEVSLRPWTTWPSVLSPRAPCSSRTWRSMTHFHMQPTGAMALEPLTFPRCLVPSASLIVIVINLESYRWFSFFHASLYKPQHLTVIIWSNSRKTTNLKKNKFGIVLNVCVWAISIYWVSLMHWRVNYNSG